MKVISHCNFNVAVISWLDFKASWR